MSKPILMCRVDGNFGGVERHILSVAQHLDRSQYHPVVVSICTKGELAAQARSLGISTDFIRMDTRWDIPSASMQLLELIERYQPSLLHTFGLRSNLLAGWSRRWNHLPWVVRLPNINTTDYNSRIRGWASHTANNLLIRKADAVQVISPQLEAYVRRRWISPRKIYTIANGIPIPAMSTYPSKEKARTLLGIPSDSVVLGSVGRLAHVKGYDRLIEAFAGIQSDFPNATLLLMGDGPEAEPLQRLAKTHAVSDSVRFVPFQRDVQPILASLDLYVCSSRSEGVPFTVLEAMAARKPIIAPRVGGIESLLTHDHNAYLIDEATPDTLREACCLLLKDNECTRRLAKHARDHVEKHHSVEGMTRSVERMYEELIHE